MGNKIDKAWELLFKSHDILSRVNSDGVFRISSTEINKVHEARLMAKFDKSAQLPEIFRQNNLSILPVTRGDYVIGPFITHEKVAYRAVRPRKIDIPPLETIDSKNLYSEAAALFFAYNSGIIKDIMGSDKVSFTVNGRMGSGAFSFCINNRLFPDKPFSVDVRNSQVEIDAGFESPEAFVICEAKNQASEEILIRQLYYPYRLWSGKLKKPVVPMFLALSNDVFHLFRYEFTDIYNYNSIKLKDYREYSLADEEITLSDVIELWRSTRIIDEPEVTFPQADYFPRVLDLLSVLHEEELSPAEVTLKYEFDPRQTSYYISACEYLGLIKRTTSDDNERKFTLTPEARNIMSMSYKNKHLALMKKLLERSVFNRAFKGFIESNMLPDRAEVINIMRTTAFKKPINETTIARRSSTVSGWLKWIIDIASTSRL